MGVRIHSVSPKDHWWASSSLDAYKNSNFPLFQGLVERRIWLLVTKLVEPVIGQHYKFKVCFFSRMSPESLIPWKLESSIHCLGGRGLLIATLPCPKLLCWYNKKTLLLLLLCLFYCVTLGIRILEPLHATSSNITLPSLSDRQNVSSF